MSNLKDIRYCFCYLTNLMSYTCNYVHKIQRLLGERYSVTFALHHQNSVCRLSSLCLRHWCTLRGLKLSATVLHHLIAQGLRQFVLKFWKEIVGVIVQLKWKRYEKLTFSTSISLYFGNNTIYNHNYNGRRIGTPIQSNPIQSNIRLLKR